MTGHTRGPWHVRTFDGSIGSIDAAGDMTVAQAMQIRPISVEPKQDERRANARLIAAAPELLGQHEVNIAALDSLLRAIGAGDPMPEIAIRVSDLIRYTREVIASATGEGA